MKGKKMGKSLADFRCVISQMHMEHEYKSLAGKYSKGNNF
jgi:hypothetical protein